MNNIKFYISSNPEALRNLNPVASIEAEFGDEIVEGSKITLTHYSFGKNNRAPCVADVEEIAFGNVVLNHFDLNILGACMKLLGYKSKLFRELFFWKSVEYIDINGPHRLFEFLNDDSISDFVEDCLNAFWAWNSENNIIVNDELTDGTDFINSAIDVMNSIFAFDEKLIERGREWADEQNSLNEDSFISHCKVGNYRIISRESDKFVNHLYSTLDGVVGNIIIAYNTDSNRIIISRENNNIKFNCYEFAKKLWEDKIEGSEDIANSLSGMSSQDFYNALNILEKS